MTKVKSVDIIINKTHSTPLPKKGNMNTQNLWKNRGLAELLLVVSSILNCCLGFEESFTLLKDAVAKSRVGTVRNMLQRGVKPDEQFFNENTK